ncbi:cell adhesion molecule 4-like isoform X2 [Ornithodoros turicata]|uniref:cell adhesion molecule 4-like isoform X2 n=1 Tax=Ornithodoros turicata TaxID=34597 RepID=UPI003138C182
MGGKGERIVCFAGLVVAIVASCSAWAKGTKPQYPAAVPPRLVRTTGTHAAGAIPPSHLVRDLSPSEYENLMKSPHVRNVTTQLGETIYLHCLVDQVADRMKPRLNIVTWIRLRDFHILTVGLATYTSDDRFQTVHMQYTNNWALQIQDSQLKDEGLYECVLNTDPPVRQIVALKVVVPKARIVGAPDLHVEAGSALNLTCTISESPEPPSFVFWYHEDRMVNFNQNRITVAKAGNDSAVSRFLIPSVGIHDSGNYTCKPSNANATSILVHVLESHRRLAAVQNDAGLAVPSGGALPCPVPQLLCVLLVALVARCDR